MVSASNVSILTKVLYKSFIIGLPRLLTYRAPKLSNE